MQIHVASGTGTGPTTLSAFDAALNDAGIANYNLIILSSVIPPRSEIIVHDGAIDRPLPGNWGDRLYVVRAEQRTDKPGEQAWAGVGWVQDAETGKGLFVEHEGYDEQGVRNDITRSLEALMRTRGMDLGEIHMKVRGVTCTDRPACALVVAVYQASDWHNGAQLF